MCHGWLETRPNIFLADSFLDERTTTTCIYVNVGGIYPFKVTGISTIVTIQKLCIMHFIITGHFNTSRKIEMGLFLNTVI